MARPSGPKIRCSGQWTEAKFRSFIKNNLRSASRKWAPIQEVKKEANIRRGIYLCAECKQEVPPTKRVGRKRVQNIFVDHINPVIDTDTGWTSWDETIDNLFCEKDNLQLLCGDCHDVKSVNERKETAEKRGYWKTHPKEYQTYVNMKGRCNNPNKSDYEYYGGRGIKLDPKWEESFLNFYKDMGDRPEGSTIDRIDVNGNYEKSNCRWADWDTQCKNKSNSVLLEYNNEIKNLSEWSEKTSIGRATIAYRLKNEFTVGEALGFDEKPSKEELKIRRKGNNNG